MSIIGSSAYNRNPTLEMPNYSLRQRIFKFQEKLMRPSDKLALDVDDNNKPILSLHSLVKGKLYFSTKEKFIIY